tara:strand:- start:279 stop:821 length:543 start_codon:yes stop_codon:yes gene_type:complete
MSKYVSYESWEKCVFKIPYIPQLEEIMDKHCICDVHEDTASLLIFEEGGYIEEFKDGTYHVTLDRSDIYDKDLDVVKRALYNWCDGELFNLQNGFKFGSYKSENGCTWDLQEFAILSDSYTAWLKKEGLPQIAIGDLLYSWDCSDGQNLTDTQRDTARSYERMWTLVDDAFNEKEDSPNA